MKDKIVDALDANNGLPIFGFIYPDNSISTLESFNISRTSDLIKHFIINQELGILLGCNLMFFSGYSRESEINKIFNLLNNSNEVDVSMFISFEKTNHLFIMVSDIKLELVQFLYYNKDQLMLNTTVRIDYGQG